MSSIAGTYGYKFVLNGTTDITDKVSNFTIECGLDMYCRELSFELIDEDMYNDLIFSEIPETAAIEVFTRITELDEYTDEYDPAWISQGKFFIERPTFRIGTDTTTTGIWGRQSTAVLGEPFAQKVTKLWSEDTSFYEICEEILESVGLTWDYTKCDLQDFSVYADNFEADDQYPIEVLQKIVELAVGAEGYVTCDREGDICIRRVDRSPTVADHNITDLVVQTFNEEPEWPDFGNRIKIIPSETAAQYSIELFTEGECMGSGSVFSMDVYAQVCDGNGAPVNDVVVDWYFDPLSPKSMWYKYNTNNITSAPTVFYKNSKQNTSKMLISRELVKATGFNSLTVKFNVSSVVGVWAYSDIDKSYNFAPLGGYVVDGKDIFITGQGFDYCDQTVFVSYYASGMAKNILMYKLDVESEPDDVEDVLGTLVVIAAVSGKEASKEIYIDNSCKCTTSLDVDVVYPYSDGSTDDGDEDDGDYEDDIYIHLGVGGNPGSSQPYTWATPVWGCDPTNQVPGSKFKWDIIAGGGTLGSSGWLGTNVQTFSGYNVVILSPPLKSSGITYCVLQLTYDGVVKDTKTITFYQATATGVS